jgi:lysophospholipase L1-like esterase
MSFGSSSRQLVARFVLALGFVFSTQFTTHGHAAVVSASVGQEEPQCPSDLPPPTPNALRIMPLGDSITEGGPYRLDEEPNPSPHESYRLYLYRKLTEAGYNVEFVGLRFAPPYGDRSPFQLPWNQGQSGAVIGPDPDYGYYSIASGFNKDDPYGNIDLALKCTYPDIVLLMAGTNDLIRRFESPGYADRAPDRLRALVDRIGLTLFNNGKGSAKILVASTLPWLIGDQVLGSPEQFEINGAAEVMGSGNDNDNVFFVDMFNKSGIVAEDFYDDGLGLGVHFKRSGAEKIADQWFKALKDNVLEPVRECDGANLVTNGSFDNGSLDNWTNYTAFGSDFTNFSDFAHMSRNGWIDQVITTVPSQTHYLAAWVRINKELRKPKESGLWLILHSDDFRSFYGGSRYLTEATMPIGQWRRVALSFTPVTTQTRITFRNYGPELDKPDGLYDADFDQVFVGLCPGSATAPTGAPIRTVFMPAMFGAK